MKQILIIDSVDDQITQYRHNCYLENDQCRKYLINYLYAIELSNTQKELMMSGIFPDFTLSEEELLLKVLKEIDRCYPDCILIHTGFVFMKYPDIFIKVLLRLKQVYPSIEIGLKKRPMLSIDMESFNNSEEIVTLLRLFRL